MILELSVKNLAVIKSVSLEFGQGLNVLTGETGAGKSILIDAIGLLLGARSSSDLVRSGARKAEVEGLFQVEPGHPVQELLTDWGIEPEEDGTLVIRREISSQGKSVSRVNGQVVTQGMLKQIGPWLIQVHGQHEYQSLLSTEQHLRWLDVFGEKEISGTSKKYTSLYKTYQEIRQELDRLLANEREATHRIDLLQFQLKEIQEANLQPGEDESLLQERNRLVHAEKLYESIEEVYQAIQGEQQGLDCVGHALAGLETAASYDPDSLKDPLDQVQAAFVQLEETARTLREYRDRLEFEPGRLTELETRLDEISRLKRKYGKTVDEILQYAEQIEQELDILQNKEDHQEQLQKKLSQISEELAVEAEKLSQLRKKVAKKLEAVIKQELKDLLMERADFKIELNHREDENGVNIRGKRIKVRETGIDEASFLIAPNPGEPLRPVAKIASGGELSRIMLALKSIFAHTEQIDSLIFDEIDTGVSGRAAQSIAEKLVKVSQNAQVLCITHLPQVASMADHHFYIDKTIDGQKTVTSVNKLDQKGQIMELSRMLGGAELTEVTIQHAEEMIRLAAEAKKKIS
ncbi:MAG: DNA repair protein RecN [Bacillaceae bacterium]|nr:DNA repair protein RecN [Bacillaceae bacterium]